MADDRREVLLDVLLRKPDVAEYESLAHWLPVWRAARSAYAPHGPFVAAVAAAVRADRMAWAFFSAYQGALCAGFTGGVVDGDGRVAAFCANESGRKLTEIQTALERIADGALRLRGRKSWTLAGIDALDLFVLARLADGPASGPGSLAVVRVRGDAAGVEFGAPRAQSVIPELPHCEATFAGVAVAKDQLLEGDGYRDYARPFRLREDVFVTGCTLAFLLAHGHGAGWPTQWRQRCIAAIVALGECASMSATNTRTELLAAGTLSFAGAVVEEADAFLASDTSPAAARWRRDKPILGGGKQARRQRAISAWARAGWPNPAQ